MPRLRIGSVGERLKILWSRILDRVDMMTWSGIRRWLFYVEEKTFFIYVWAIPLTLVLIKYGRELLGLNVHIPEMLVESFLIATVYVAAHSLYLIFCPYKIKNIKNDRDWLENYIANMERVNTAMESYQKTLRTAKDIAEFAIDQGHEIEIGIEELTPEVMKLFKTSLVGHILARTGSMPPFVDDINESSYERMRALDKERRLARLLTASFLFLVVLGSLYETGAKIWEVLHAAFEP